MHDQAVLGILTHEGFGHVHQDAVDPMDDIIEYHCWTDLDTLVDTEHEFFWPRGEKIREEMQRLDEPR